MNMCCLNLLFTCLIALLTYSRSGDWTGLLAKLCDILMASGVPADVLTETINTVAEVIRGNQYNQEYFASVMAPSTPPRYSDRAFSSRLPLFQNSTKYRRVREFRDGRSDKKNEQVGE